MIHALRSSDPSDFSPFAETAGAKALPSTIALLFALLAAAAWAASPGISVALASYGAAIVSAGLYRRSRASTPPRRAAWLLGAALAWLVALAFSAMVLPSNFGAAVL